MPASPQVVRSTPFKTCRRNSPEKAGVCSAAKFLSARPSRSACEQSQEESSTARSPARRKIGVGEVALFKGAVRKGNTREVGAQPLTLRKETRRKEEREKSAAERSQLSKTQSAKSAPRHFVSAKEQAENFTPEKAALSGLSPCSVPLIFAPQMRSSSASRAASCS